MTPRGGGGPGGGGGKGEHGGSSSRQVREAYRGNGKGRQYEISPSACASLKRDEMLYLAKKLVHLSILLEQDTVVDDFAYPSFHK